MNSPDSGEEPIGMNPEIHQLQILHLSDLHFGSSHFFQPDSDPQGNPLKSSQAGNLLPLLSKDVKSGNPQCPTLVALTGDFTTKHEEKGFQQAATFIAGLKKSEVLGAQRDPDSFLLVPGNHDVSVETMEPDEKWLRYDKFHAKVTNQPLAATRDPLSHTRLIDRSSAGYMVLCLNSSMYVEKGKDDQWRGQIDEDQLEKIERLLRKEKKKLKSVIKVAMIHHHPVLIPALVEGGRGYDAVIRSGNLINLLHKYGFHLILHGHKHWPCTFSIDGRNGYDSANARPIIAVSGGSIGSKELPNGKKPCYNQILLKWNSATDELRVHTTTRGLVTEDKNGQALVSRGLWEWETLRTDDRTFYRDERAPVQCVGEYIKRGESHRPYELQRKAEYARLGDYMPVVEVRPSFVPFQKYEAVFWLVPHSAKNARTPSRVVWSAGPMFPTIQVDATRDKRFCGSFAYYGPMLVQAAIYFQGVTEPELAYVYARLPSDRDYIKAK